MRAAYSVCDFAIKTQSENGEYAKVWDADENVVVRNGTVGAFLILPMVVHIVKAARQNIWSALYKPSVFITFACVRRLYYGERIGHILH